MVTEKMFGQSMLMDGDTRVILRGEIALITDGHGRSEIQVRNDETGMMERLVFTTGALWIPVMQLIQAIRDTHTPVDLHVGVIDGSGGVCATCGGAGQAQDTEGNWRQCPACGGVP